MCDLSINNDVSEVILSRQRSLQELIEFTESCQKKLSGIFELLGWNTDSFQEPMEVCPYDPNHRVPRRSLERHKVSCQLSKMGYSREEQAAMYDPSVCYEKANIPSIVIDKPTQRQIILQAKASAPPARVEGLYSQSDYSADPGDVPQNHQRAICDLTVADRLSLYDHVIREASQLKAQMESKDNDDLYVDLVAKLKKGDDSDGPKSHLEVLAEMRDYKRRRQSYRAKNVHITKKSYTEVIREVIDVHSCELARVWQEEEREEEKESVEKVEPESRSSKLSSHRRRSEERRSGSAESRQSCTSSRDDRGNRGGHRHSRDRDRDRNRSRERDRDRHRERDRESRRKRDSRSPHENHRKEKKSRKS